MKINKSKVLIVDDEEINLDLFRKILSDEYLIQVATNGEEALKIAISGHRPDIIMLDVVMDGIDGYEVCRRLKANETTKNIPIIFVSARSDKVDETKGFELGAVDYIAKPVSPPIVRARVATHLALYKQNMVLEKKVMERTAALSKTNFEIVKILGKAAEYKDNETGMHIIRMSYYCKILAKAYGLGSKDVELYYRASPMHDIGKIGIPDSILLKPSALTEEEWVIMKRHCVYGANILHSDFSKLIQLAKLGALTHHERWNGQGYPKGLSGEDIPLIGRIIALADVFDALTSKRPYKKAWDTEVALEFIQSQKGKHFEPKLVELFFQNLEEILEIKETYGEENEGVI